MVSGLSLVRRWAALCGVAVLLWSGFAPGTEEPAKEKGGATKSRSSGATGEKGLKRNKASDKALLKLAGKEAKLKHTPHYAIAYDTDEATLKAFVSRIERTYSSVTKFAERTGVEVKRPAEKLQILFFDTVESYAKYGASVGFPASEDVPGFYSGDTNRSAFFNIANSKSFQELKKQMEQERRRGQQAARSGQLLDFSRLNAFQARLSQYEEKLNRSVVQHEVAHQVLFNIGVHSPQFHANPRWLAEGLAMMFETPPSAGGAGLGAVNQSRLESWRDLYDAGALPSVESLIKDAGMFHRSAEEMGVAYTQSWALVHYLLRRRGKQFVTYLDRIRQRTEDRAYTAEEEMQMFVEVFGKPDKKFVEQMEKYLLKIPYRPSEAGP
jgi:hypothetical protein